MFRKFFVIFLLFVNAAFAAGENSQVENWNSDAGLKKLSRSQFNNDFYQLVNFYQPQENPLFCSIATGTILRNAFDYGEIAPQKIGAMQKPDGSVSQYSLYSQRGFFNEKTEKVKKRAVVENTAPNAVGNFDAGLSLGDFAKMLKLHGMKVKLIYAEENNVEFSEKFRQVLKKILAEKKNFIVVNFDGQVLGKETRGHISPLVAFDEESDSVLVLDVALHKNQWYWVEVTKLIAAMNTKDDATYRGYLVVGK